MRQPEYLRQSRNNDVEKWLASEIKSELMEILVARKHHLLEPADYLL
jgi:hypothetical protein